MIHRTYYILFLFLGLLYSQDPPQDFEFNQSTQQGFYFFLNIDILGEELSENDWVGVFNSYDESLAGECVQDEINTDETLGGMCMTLSEGDFQCTPGFPSFDDCVSNNLCNASLDVDNDNFLTECACADINDDGFIFSQNLEISVGSRMYGDCLNYSRVPCDIPAMGYDGNCYSAGYLTGNQIPYFKIYDSSEDRIHYAYPSDVNPFSPGSYYFVDSNHI